MIGRGTLRKVVVAWASVVVLLAIGGTLRLTSQSADLRHDLLSSGSYRTHALAFQTAAALCLLWTIAGSVGVLKLSAAGRSRDIVRITVAAMLGLMMILIGWLTAGGPYQDPPPFGLTLDSSLRLGASACAAVGLLSAAVLATVMASTSAASTEGD